MPKKVSSALCNSHPSYRPVRLLVKLLDDSDSREKIFKAVQFALQLFTLGASRFTPGGSKAWGRTRKAAQYLSASRRMFKLLRYVQTLDTIPDALAEADPVMRTLFLSQTLLGTSTDICYDLATAGIVGVSRHRFCDPVQTMRTHDWIWLVSSALNIFISIVQIHRLNQKRQELELRLHSQPSPSPANSDVNDLHRLSSVSSIVSSSPANPQAADSLPNHASVSTGTTDDFGNQDLVAPLPHHVSHMSEQDPLIIECRSDSSDRVRVAFGQEIIAERGLDLVKALAALRQQRMMKSLGLLKYILQFFQAAGGLELSWGPNFAGFLACGLAATLLSLHKTSSALWHNL